MASRERPKASSDAVRSFMKNLPRKNTGPEIALRRCLHRRGVRFRLHRRDLPGSPDIVIVRLRIAVFVNGCFWHGCPEHAVAPKSNAEWWAEKLRKNRERDARKDTELRELGWKAVHVWEHENPEQVADWLAREWMNAS
jgi:DNA mismatch endonuclease, patch repair protein